MTGPIPLGRSATRGHGVGAKAGLLSIAAAEGLPVLRGMVLPADASSPAIITGAAALARGERAQAYLAASSVDVDPADLEALATVGRRLVVRSSTALDLDGRWSGAFASYLDVESDDLATAVRGCWSSVFTHDALERCEATGTDPSSVRIGVLVQPWLGFAFGGTARVEGDGDVRIAVATGGAHGVVAGHGGSTIVVAAGGRVLGDADIPHDLVVAAADLARDALRTTGVGTVEWGATGERLVLLQVGPGTATAPSHRDRVPTTGTRASLPADAARVARIVARFRGALAEDVILPWALGAPGDLDVPPIAVDDVPVAVAEIRATAPELVDAVWGLGRRDVAANAIDDLRGVDVRRGLATVRGLESPDPAVIRRVVGLIEGVGHALEARGILPAAEAVWRLSPAELDAAAAGTPPAVRAGPDRWEPFLVEVALALGTHAEGTAVARGLGAGRLHVVSTLRGLGRPSPRSVLAATAPLPQLAPLLWHCSAFVTPRGSAGAHLFEVARSLGVPAVIGVALADVGPPGSLVAVDGVTGTVASLGAPADGRVRRSA